MSRRSNTICMHEGGRRLAELSAGDVLGPTLRFVASPVGCSVANANESPVKDAKGFRWMVDALESGTESLSL
eukprot:457117-Pleurochrysis_carterae.AAC.2